MNEQDTKPIECPFCGYKLEPYKAAAVDWIHPRSDCILSEFKLVGWGSEARWNHRAKPSLAPAGEVEAEEIAEQLTAAYNDAKHPEYFRRLAIGILRARPQPKETSGHDKSSGVKAGT